MRRVETAETTSRGAEEAGRRRLWLRARRVMGGACVAAGLLGCMATPALAATGNTGSTKVTVVADASNLRFRVPTVIPFVAASDGTLTGPSADATRIENLSAYGLKVTNLRVTPANGWSHKEDITTSDDSINWVIGPKGAEVSAPGAAKESGTGITSPLWNMTYYSAGTETDDIKLSTAGAVARVAQDISSPVQVGTVTFTLAPGAHKAAQSAAAASEEPGAGAEGGQADDQVEEDPSVAEGPGIEHGGDGEASGEGQGES